jgi:acyl-coenzyme A thioesterase 13
MMIDEISSSLAKETTSFNRVLSTLELVDKDARRNTVTYRMTVSESECNIANNCHGGFIATAVDVVSTMSLFLHASGQPSVSVDLSVSYLKAIPKGTTVDFAGAVQRRGRTLAFLTCIVQDSNTPEIVYASGKHTVMFVPNASL